MLLGCGGPVEDGHEVRALRPEVGEGAKEDLQGRAAVAVRGVVGVVRGGYAYRGARTPRT